MASELRVNTINSRTGFGTITVSETGQDLVGITTIENLTAENTLVGAAASFTGNVQIGGVLTYEDVTNIDSVGLITARQGIEIGARPGVAASISVDGNMIVSGVSTFAAVSGTTGTFSGAVSGTTGTFSGAVSGTTGTFTGDVDIADKIVHTGDTNTAIRFPSADVVSVETGGYERLRVHTGGQLLLGTTTSDSVWGYGDSFLQLKGNYSGSSASFINNEASTNSSAITLAKVRGSSTIVNSGDTLGAVIWQGFDGTDYEPAARISGLVDGTPGGGDMPGRLIFETTADGAEALTERLRIDQGGRVLFGNYFTSQQIGGYTSALQIQGTDHNFSSASIFRYSNDDGGPTLTLGKGRGGGGGVEKAANNDNIGSIRFVMANNNNLQDGNVARIDCHADGVPSGGDTPGRLSFWTAPDNTSAPVENVRIKANGSLLCKGKYNSQAGSAFMEIGNGHVSIADESSVTLSSAANTGVLVSIGINKGATGNTTYDHGLFFCSYGVANSVEVADGGGDFSNSDTNGYLCVYTTGSANVVVKNRLGHTTNVSIGLIRYLGN